VQSMCAKPDLPSPPASAATEAILPARWCPPLPTPARDRNLIRVWYHQATGWYASVGTLTRRESRIVGPYNTPPEAIATLNSAIIDFGYQFDRAWDPTAA
jgi:hypothetical protein